MTTFRDQHPALWTVEPIPGHGFEVLDAIGDSLAYIYAGDDGQTSASQELTLAEARSLAEMIAKPPELVGKG